MKPCLAIMRSMPTPEQILNIAKEYRQTPRHPSMLEPYKDGVLLLRSKDASYEKIATTLSSNEFKVSAATIRKFCLQHAAEIKRLRSERHRLSDDSATEAKSNNPSAAQPPIGSFTVKPGPKIARENL
jgi:hypothetical protein